MNLSHWQNIENKKVAKICRFTVIIKFSQHLYFNISFMKKCIVFQFFIDPNRLLPLARFLAQPKGARGSRGGVGGRGGRGGRGGL